MKRIFSLLTALFAATAAMTAHAQSYPDRPIRLIVPFPAGGTVDTLARKTAQAMQAGLKQSVVIDNRPGANGVIGVEAAIKSPPDGYTMLFNSASMLINQVINPSIRYDILRDLVPVSEAMGLDAYLLLVNAQSPHQNLGALLAEARKKPGAMNYASPGVGNGQHLLMETLNHKAGIRMTHVPYKGIPDMANALMRNEVDSMVLNPLLAEPHLKSGKFRALAQVTGTTTRLPSMPDLPAISETLPGFTWTAGRFGFFFPANTPPAIVARMQGEVANALQMQELKDYLKTGGFLAVGGTSQEFTQAISGDLQRFAEIARLADIKAN